MRFAYDLIISGLASKSSGLHEISLVFELNRDENDHKKKVKIVCSDF